MKNYIIKIGGLFMKKLLSIFLSAITILSALMVIPSAFASTQKPYETTFSSNDSIYGNSNGTVYRQGDKLIFKSPNSKTITLDKITYNRNTDLYMRGKTVFYTVSNSNKYTLYSISINGKNKKKIAENIGYLIGGYGYDSITKKGKAINKIDQKGKVTKVTTLPSDVSYVSAFFSKKIYFTYKNNPSKYYVYNLKTGKSSSLKGKEINAGKNYLFYLNNNNLMRIYQNGKKEKLEKDVYRIYGCNDGATVVYSKKDKSGKEVFYRKTSTKKAKKLCTITEIEKKVLSIIKKPFPDYETLNGVECAVITKNNVCFNVSHYEFEDSTDMLISVNINGGKLKLFERNRTHRINILRAVGSNISFLVTNDEDYPIKYSVKTLK